MNELKKELIVQKRTKQNSNLVIFKCLNVLDRQKFHISIMENSNEEEVELYKRISNEFVLTSEFFQISNNKIIQITKIGELTLISALERRKILFDEYMARKLIKMLLTVLEYFKTILKQSFDFSVQDIFVVKNLKVSSQDSFTFKLKNHFLERICRYAEGEGTASVPGVISLINYDEHIDCHSAIEKIGRLVYCMAKNPFKFRYFRKSLTEQNFSESFLYVVRVMIRYRSLAHRPSIPQLLEFFQDSKELFNERVKRSLFPDVDGNSKTINKRFINNFRKSSFF